MDAPWRSYAADFRDFFNYDMTMRTWKEYAKRVQLHRVESAMSRKIQTLGAPQARSLLLCSTSACSPAACDCSPLTKLAVTCQVCHSTALLQC